MKKHRVFEVKYPMNFHPINLVDEDVQSMLFPLNLIDIITSFPKYTIKNNLITTSSYMRSLLCLPVTFIFICCYVYRAYIMTIEKDIQNVTSFLLATAYYDCIFYSLGFILNFTVAVIQCKHKLRFILTFQKVHRFINDNKIFNVLIFWNWMTFILALLCYITISTYFYISLDMPSYMKFCCFLMIVFDLNIVYAIRLIKLLEQKVVLWNKRALNFENNEAKYANESKKMFQAYVDILQCYSIYKDSFQYSILYYTVEIFISTLAYIQVTFDMVKEGSKYNNMYAVILASVSIYSLMVKNFIWQTILCMHCEKFYLAAQNVQDTCTLILKLNLPDSEKKLYKNVVRLHRASFSKLSACGLFYVDAALQLSLMGLLTNYIVVLLQFAVL